MHGAQRVLGVLVLFKAPSSPDFDLRQVRIVELLARRVAYILLNAYDPTTGLLTRPAFEKRAQLLLTPQALAGNNGVIYIDIDRLHVLNENLGMHVGDEVIVRVAEVIRRNLTPAHAGGAHLRGSLRRLRHRRVGRRCADHRREPARRPRPARVRGRQPAGRGLGQLRRGARRRQQASAVPRARRGRDRLQGGQGSRPRPGRDLRGQRPEHRAPLHGRDPGRHAALRARAGPLPSRSAGHRAPERRGVRPEVRAAVAHDRRGRPEHLPGQVPLGGRALPARARHRPVGGAPRAADAGAPGRRSCCSAAPVSP